jgi:hypothetical protein
MKSTFKLSDASLPQMEKELDRMFEATAALFEGASLVDERLWLQEMLEYGRRERELPPLPAPDFGGRRSFSQKMFILKVYRLAEKRRKNIKEGEDDEIEKRIFRETYGREMTDEDLQAIVDYLGENLVSDEKGYHILGREPIRMKDKFS